MEEIILIVTLTLLVIVIMIKLINLFDESKKFKLNNIIVNTDTQSKHYLENGKIIDIKDSEKNGKEFYIEYKNKEIEIYPLEYSLNYIMNIGGK